MGISFDKEDIIRILTSVIPLAVECTTLVRVLRGSKHRFAIMILVMLIGFNLTNICTEVIHLDLKIKFESPNALYQHCFDNPDSCPVREFQTSVIFTCIGILLFDVAHWLFAHKYFSLSR